MARAHPPPMDKVELKPEQRMRLFFEALSGQHGYSMKIVHVAPKHDRGELRGFIIPGEEHLYEATQLYNILSKDSGRISGGSMKIQLKHEYKGNIDGKPVFVTYPKVILTGRKETHLMYTHSTDIPWEKVKRYYDENHEKRHFALWHDIEKKLISPVEEAFEKPWAKWRKMLVDGVTDDKIAQTYMQDHQKAKKKAILLAEKFIPQYAKKDKKVDDGKDDEKDDKKVDNKQKPSPEESEYLYYLKKLHDIPGYTYAHLDDFSDMYYIDNYDSDSVFHDVDEGHYFDYYYQDESSHGSTKAIRHFYHYDNLQPSLNGNVMGYNQNTNSVYHELFDLELLVFSMIFACFIALFCFLAGIVIGKIHEKRKKENIDYSHVHSIDDEENISN